MRRAAALAVVALAGCGSSAATSTRHATANVRSTPLARSLRLSSPALAPHGRIPRTYTCDGHDISLPLRWSGVPRGTRELLLVMRDLDAQGFVQWAVARIPARSGSFGAGHVGGGAVQGRNDFGHVGYGGPCPPRGDAAHEYVLTLMAMAGPSGVQAGFQPSAAVRSEVLAIATLEGTYSRR